jgi:hypothetical protein
MLKDAAMQLLDLAVGFYFLINAVYALRSPAGYLNAKWTLRRGMRTETPHRDVRFLGIVWIVAAAFWGFASYRELCGSCTVEGTVIVQYLVLIFWCLGVLSCLANGFFAFLSPVRWMRTWGAGRLRGLDNPVLVRVLAALMIVVGVVWAVLGIHMVRRLKH